MLETFQEIPQNKISRVVTKGERQTDVMTLLVAFRSSA